MTAFVQERTRRGGVGRDCLTLVFCFLCLMTLDGESVLNAGISSSSQSLSATRAVLGAVAVSSADETGFDFDVAVSSPMNGAKEEKSGMEPDFRGIRKVLDIEEGYFPANQSMQGSPKKQHHGPPSLLGGRLDYGKIPAKHEAERTRKKLKIRLPPRKSCGKGWYDSELDACVWRDSQDRRLPFYECPNGSVLKEDFCYGRITSDYELECPRDYDSNEDDLCVRVIVYSPTRVKCPPGFELKTYTNARIKQCVKEKYTAPIVKPFSEPASQAFLLDCKKKTKKSEEKKCRDALMAATAQKFVVQCPEGGKLIESKTEEKTACLVRIVVPPEAQEQCKKGYRWSRIAEYGGACVRIWAKDASRVCPVPNPKLGPGFGDWETPRYQYDPIDRCVATKAKATNGSCPFGYAMQNDWCVRQYILPPYLDCKNLEGFAFVWDPVEQSGSCVYEYDSFQWAKGPSYGTKRAHLDAKRIYFMSSPVDVWKADGAQQFRSAQTPFGGQLSSVLH